MDDLTDPVLLADRGHEVVVGDVAHHQWRVDHGVGIAEFERVEHDDVASGGRERTHRVGADVPGAAGDEDSGHGAKVARRGRHVLRPDSAAPPVKRRKALGEWVLLA